MKKLIPISQIIIIVIVISTLAIGAEQVIRYDEAMVGRGHPTLSDTLNRGFLIQHNAEGVHTIVPWSTITGAPTTFPWDNISNTPTTLAGYGIVDAMTALVDNSITPAKLQYNEGTADNTTFYRGDGKWMSPSVSFQEQIDAKQNYDPDLAVLSFPTAWRMFYSNGSNAITEFAMGASGTYLMSQGASSAPIFSALDADLLTLASPTAWRLYYSGASGYSALSFGTVDLCLKSGGASAAPTWGACGEGAATTTLPWDNITSRPTINSVTVTGAVLDNASNYPAALARLSSPTFTGTVVIPGGTLDGVTIGGITPGAGSFSSLTRGAVSDAEFLTLDNVTTGTTIQAQLNNKQALDNGTFTGEVTGTQFNSLGADGTHYINVANSSAPSDTTVGNCYYDNTTFSWLCRNASAWAAPSFTAIGQGSNPTVDDPGEIAVDTTADQLLYYGGALKVVDPRHTENATFKTPVSGDKAKFRKPYGMTVTSIGCVTDTTTSVLLDTYECDANGATCTTALQTAQLTCGTTYSFAGSGGVTTLAHTDIAGGNYISIVLGTVTSTPGYLYVDINYTVTRQ